MNPLRTIQELGRRAARRVAGLLPRNPLRRWALLAGAALGLLLLGGGALMLFGFGLRVHVDLGLALLAVPAAILAVAVVKLVDHRLRPRRSVTVQYDLKLIQPQLKTGRYLFKLDVYYELEERGKRQTIRQGSVELQFRRRDHPELFEWCSTQLTAYLSRHRELAAERFPDARVHAGPELTIDAMAAAAAQLAS